MVVRGQRGLATHIINGRSSVADQSAKAARAKKMLSHSKHQSSTTSASLLQLPPLLKLALAAAERDKADAAHEVGRGNQLEHDAP